MWLLRDGEVLATLEEPRTRAGRRRGLIGRNDFEGALLLRPAKAVHTFGLSFPIDVAYCDRELRVLVVTCMPPMRLGRPRLRAHGVIEAAAGAFERWGLSPGDVLEVKGDG